MKEPAAVTTGFESNTKDKVEGKTQDDTVRAGVQSEIFKITDFL